jgi:PhzF family phenazine biosynthesis protein
VVQLFHVDAFAEEPFHGNPAAVCLLDAPRADDWMLAVAAEMNLPETAFAIACAPESAGEHSLRWFTPKVEVELCGHATLATAHVLWETRKLDRDATAGFRTASGMLECTLAADGTIWMDFPSLRSVEIETPDGLAAALGAAPERVARNDHDYLVELGSAAVVRELRPDFARLASFDVRAVVVTALADPDDDHDFVSRCFGPRVGIDEDPVTGSAHCALGPWWSTRIGRTELVGYQASTRAGIVRVRVEEDRVHLGGRAVTVVHGALVE